MAYNIFNREIFDGYAVTDYIIFNVDTGMDKALRMFSSFPLTITNANTVIRVDRTFVRPRIHRSVSQPLGPADSAGRIEQQGDVTLPS